MVETIIFAMIAAFLGLRLYGVLGKRTGHEHPLGGTGDAQLPPKTVAVDRGETSEPAPALVEEMLPYDEQTALGLRAIAKADSSFNAADFLGGSKAAYAMILEAFWRGDIGELQPLVSDDVGEAFAHAITARKEAGEVLENRLVQFDRTTIKSATLDGRTARISVQFDADIAAVTRNAEGKVIAGSTNDAVATHDVWTFERDVRAATPDWILVDTDETDG